MTTELTKTDFTFHHRPASADPNVKYIHVVERAGFYSDLEPPEFNNLVAATAQFEFTISQLAREALTTGGKISAAKEVPEHILNNPFVYNWVALQIERVDELVPGLTVGDVYNVATPALVEDDDQPE